MRTASGAQRAATRISRDDLDTATAHSPTGQSLDPAESPAADIGSQVTAVLVAAEELARQIVADARAEAARITSNLESLEHARAESQARLGEEAAELLRTCRAAEDELNRAIHELSAVTGRHPDPQAVASAPLVGVVDNDPEGQAL